VNWSILNPILNARLSENRIDTWGWNGNTSLDLKIADGLENPYTDSQVTDVNGYANFDLPAAFGLEASQEITITDGNMSKTLRVLDPYANFYDASTRTVIGYSKPGARVGVSMWVENGWKEVFANDSGFWKATYDESSGPFLRSTSGEFSSWDEDGDATYARINYGNIFAWLGADFIELQNVAKSREYVSMPI
jgi:hypothetical protein